MKKYTITITFLLLTCSVMMQSSLDDAWQDLVFRTIDYSRNLIFPNSSLSAQQPQCLHNERDDFGTYEEIGEKTLREQIAETRALTDDHRSKEVHNSLPAKNATPIQVRQKTKVVDDGNPECGFIFSDQKDYEAFLEMKEKYKKAQEILIASQAVIAAQAAKCDSPEHESALESTSIPPSRESTGVPKASNNPSPLQFSTPHVSAPSPTFGNAA
ncbi:MAG TPA: hypothetical protein VLG50_03405 [Candidatus Saccharimonadales bacterium]|nr:hypothetical protein [Candidatus Saccharimonadales bacterium]